MKTSTCGACAHFARVAVERGCGHYCREHGFPITSGCTPCYRFAVQHPDFDRCPSSKGLDTPKPKR